MINLDGVAYIWGGNPEMAIAELEAILYVYDRDSYVQASKGRLVYFKASEEAIKRVNAQAAFTRYAGTVVGEISNGRLGDMWLTLRDVDLSAFKVIDKTGLGLERQLGDVIVKAYHGKVSLERPHTLIVTAKSDDKVIVLAVQAPPEKGFWARKNKRVYFEISALSPQLARFLVNLAMVKEGSLFLDPFAGSMSIPAEAASLGAYVIGSDVDIQSAQGGFENMKNMFISGWDVLVADAIHPPFREGIFDSIASDPPFGRLKKPFGNMGSYLDFLSSFVLSAGRLLSPLGGLAFLLPQGIDQELLPWEEAGLKLLRLIPMRAHKSFTRYVARAIKTG
ncbi:MAG: hypothetical protein ACP5GO_00810 [Thermoprotei archaeon]